MEVAADTAVVMATHDGARFLASQIESILAQSLLPAVVMIVDDASRDGTADLIREIARTSPIPIDIVAAVGSGEADPKSRITASIMQGMAAVASFEFVVLSDQDDEWLPGRLLAPARHPARPRGCVGRCRRRPPDRRVRCRGRRETA